MEKKAYIEAGKIVNTHGVAGELKVEVWLDSPAFMKRFPRLFVGEREYKLLTARVQKSFLLCRLEGVDDLNAAMALKGRVVSVAREDAKLPRRPTSCRTCSARASWMRRGGRSAG